MLTRRVASCYSGSSDVIGKTNIPHPHQRWFLGVANNHPVFILKQMPYIKRSKCRNNKLTTYKVQTLFGDHLLTMCMSVGKSTEPNNIIKVKQLQLSKNKTTLHKIMQALSSRTATSANHLLHAFVCVTLMCADVH